MSDGRRDYTGYCGDDLPPLVYFEKIDGTQAASIDIAIDKARSSARFK